MHATNHGKETCAYKRCCQPVDREITHQPAHPEMDAVAIGYCIPHAEKLIERRLAEVPGLPMTVVLGRAT